MINVFNSFRSPCFLTISAGCRIPGAPAAAREALCRDPRQGETSPSMGIAGISNSSVQLLMGLCEK